MRKDRLANLAASNRIPAIYSLRESVVSGGLRAMEMVYQTLIDLSATMLLALLGARSPLIYQSFNPQNSSLYSMEGGKGTGTDDPGRCVVHCR